MDIVFIILRTTTVVHCCTSKMKKMKINFYVFSIQRAISTFLSPDQFLGFGHILTEVIVDNLGEGSETVCGAGCVGDDLHGRLVLLLVNSHNEHGGISRGGGDNHVLGSSLNTRICF